MQNIPFGSIMRYETGHSLQRLQVVVRLVIRSPDTAAFLFELALLPGGETICICMWHAMWRLAGTKHRCCVMANLAVLVCWSRRLMLHAARQWLSIDCTHGPERRVVIHDSNEIIHFGRSPCLLLHLPRVLLGILRPWNRLAHVSVTDIDNTQMCAYPKETQRIARPGWSHGYM